MIEPRRLGRTDIAVSAIGLGCWQFSQGRGFLGAFWPVLPQETVNRIVAVSLAGGITWFDTAESYGDGLSETALAAALTAAGKRNGDVVVASKWRPFFRTAASIRNTIGTRLDRLLPFGIDLHQIHHPFAFASIAAQMHAMADLVEAGRIRSVGVSNCSAAAMRTAHGALASRGIPLATNQVRYSLADRRIEKNGVLETARELGITIIAYSPLAQGILTGKFHRDPALIRSRPGPRRWMSTFRHGGLGRSRPLVEIDPGDRARSRGHAGPGRAKLARARARRGRRGDPRCHHRRAGGGERGCDGFPPLRLRDRAPGGDLAAVPWVRITS